MGVEAFSILQRFNPAAFTQHFHNMWTLFVNKENDSTAEIKTTASDHTHLIVQPHETYRTDWSCSTGTSKNKHDQMGEALWKKTREAWEILSIHSHLV